ncbi:hypothetical protein [Thalassotalea sediminis]|uniref:hypothetical protein n=1 Tax=Thalassotalea sediminis TaxID=1759089 RepID=UPI002573B40E|nr:hypothetical protein [Thalassotalea sediminis]
MFEQEAEKEYYSISVFGIASSIGIFSLLGMLGEKSSNQGIWLIVPFSLFIQLAILNRSQRWHAEDMGVYKNTH